MDWDDFPVIQGFGTLHDLRDGDNDPRNPRLAGLKSVSYAGAVGLAKNAAPKVRKVGFIHRRPR